MSATHCPNDLAHLPENNRDLLPSCRLPRSKIDGALATTHDDDRSMRFEDRSIHAGVNLAGVIEHAIEG